MCVYFSENKVFKPNIMKKNYLFLFLLAIFAGLAWGQTTTINFESAGSGYTPSATNGSSYTDVFNRINTDLPGVSNEDGYYWAMEDYSGNPNIQLDQIDISGATSFTFSIDLTAHHYNDWDDSDELLITYSLDEGTYQNLMWVQNTGAEYNDPVALDTDFDGDGECGNVLPALTTGTGNDGCSVSTKDFKTFSTSSISLSGNSTLDIKLQFNGLTATDEGIYIDNIIITQNAGVPTPTVLVTLSELSGFSYTEGNGPSASQSFKVSGTNLTADISVTPPANYEISVDDANFQSTSINLTESSGSVAETTIYARLKAGLSEGNYNNEDISITSTDATTKTVTCNGAVTGELEEVLISRNCDPRNNYAPDRFAEIYNASGSTVDLTGWTLENVQGGVVQFTWTLSGNIAPGQTLICGRDDNTSQTISPDFTASWSGSSWNGKGGDGTILKDNSATVVDYAVQNDGSGKFENGQMKRKLSVATPTSTYNSSEWVFTSIDNANDVLPGFHGTIWIGGGTGWSTDDHWDCEVPTSSSDVAIPNVTTEFPTITGAVECNNIILKSDASGNASLIGQGNLTVNGSATIERYISPYSVSNDGWHFLSSPVNSMTIAGSDFVNGTYDLYRWAETESADEKWYNYEGGSFGHTQFENGLGYLFADATGGVFEFSGTMNSGSYNKTLTYTAGEGDGWNLIGNPYPSGIDWTALDKSAGNIGAAFYIVDPADGSYNSSNGSIGDLIPANEIPPHQGFFIQVSAASSIGIDTDDQVHTSNNYYKSEIGFDETLVVDLKGNSSNSKTYFQFRDDATKGFDFHADAYKLFGWADHAQLYSEIENTKYSINCLPHSEETITVPLGLSLQSDEELSLNFAGMQTFFNTIKIELEDKKLGRTQNIKDNPVYVFQAFAQDEPNRFVLHFNGVTGIENPGMNSIQVYSIDDAIYINNQENLNADILVYNINGQLIHQDQITAKTFERINLGTSAGVYLVNIVTEETISTHKVYVK